MPHLIGGISVPNFPYLFHVRDVGQPIKFFKNDRNKEMSEINYYVLNILFLQWELLFILFLYLIILQVCRQ